MRAVVGAPRSAARRMGSRSSEGGFVDLAGEGDDGGDGLGEGLAGAGDRLLHAVEEACACRGDACSDWDGWSGGFFVAFSEEVEGHALSSLSDWRGIGFART